MHCEPATSIIVKFKGLKAVAEITGVRPHTVMRWRYPRSKRGTGGIIPHRHADRLLAFARENGIELSPADFFNKEASV
jgi:hypothetical protein